MHSGQLRNSLSSLKNYLNVAAISNLSCNTQHSLFPAHYESLIAKRHSIPDNKDRKSPDPHPLTSPPQPTTTTPHIHKTAGSHNNLPHHIIRNASNIANASLQAPETIACTQESSVCNTHTQPERDALRAHVFPRSHVPRVPVYEIRERGVRMCLNLVKRPTE